MLLLGGSTVSSTRRADTFACQMKTYSAQNRNLHFPQKQNNEIGPDNGWPLPRLTVPAESFYACQVPVFQCLLVCLCGDASPLEQLFEFLRER